MRKVLEHEYKQYSESDLRALIINTAMPIDSSADVRKRIRAKYEACDKEMLLWFAFNTYGGVLWSEDKVEISVTEIKRRALKIELKAPIKRVEVPKMHTVVQPVWHKSVSRAGRSKSIFTARKQDGFEIAPGVWVNESGEVLK